MSNGWVVPFSEKIDWSRAALIWDERLLIEFKDFIAEIDQETISRMRQQAAWYYRIGVFFEINPVKFLRNYKPLKQHIFQLYRQNCPNDY